MADRLGPDLNSDREVIALGFTAGGLLLAGVAGVWVSMHAAAAWAGTPAPAGHPVELIADLVKGRAQWTQKATVVAVAYAAVIVAVAGSAGVWLLRRAGKRQRVDRAARYMASGKDLRSLNPAGAAAIAKRLGVTASASGKPGVPLGRSVRTKGRLYSSWEDMLVVIAGPRTMKSTAYAIPAIMAAPGALLATSNKRDVVDATRGSRAQLGEVWVFDPQEVANTAQDWWWNPLTYIAPFDPATGGASRDPRTGHVDADETRARKLASQFAAAVMDTGKADYWDTEAESLLAYLLLAAAVGELPVTVVYTWATRPTDDTPALLLEEHGYELQSEAMRSWAGLNPKQRDGIYGGVKPRVEFLTNRKMRGWVTAGETRQFHPAEFATSSDTLYPLSREGDGGAGPLVAALTLAVIEELEQRATASPGGRLPVPFLAVLDEAANICRFRNLDSYYSHFGSRGIIIMTILQNWAQGEEVWGVKGMEKLWSAANVKVYGGGVDDDRFLRRVSDLIGTHTHLTRSTSTGRGKQGRSTSTSTSERTTLTIGELRALPQGRAVLFASGTPAALIQPVPWFTGPDAGVINASLATHAPQRPSAATTAATAGRWVVAPIESASPDSEAR